jgi:MSHA biogenesis protein MshM
MAIARASGGVPRLINVIAHKCLMLAYGENVHRVNTAHVRLAVQDTPGVVPRAAWWRRLWTTPLVRMRFAPYSGTPMRPHTRSKQ